MNCDNEQSVTKGPCSSVCMLSRFSHAQLFVTLQTVAHQASLSTGFSWQKYWSGLPFPPPGNLPNLGIEGTSLIFPALAGRFLTTSATWEARSSMEIVFTSYEKAVRVPRITLRTASKVLRNCVQSSQPLEHCEWLVSIA